MSSLLKNGWIEIKEDEKRIIDTNDYVSRKLGSLNQSSGNSNMMSRSEPDEDGFSSGFDAEILSGLTEDADGEAALTGENAASAGPSREELEQEIQRMKQQAEEILENARREAQSIEELAKEAALNLRNEARQEGLSEGYNEGMRNAQVRMEQMEAELQEREQQLEARYEEKLQQLEPMFIDNLTSIYEHVFHVELRSYREILSYLIAGTMRKIEGTKDFYVHVSKEDYPFISMQKKQLMAATGATGAMVEVVEDITLSKNQCMIETEGGVFDCGVDTQLSELSARLKLLSYERT